MVRKIEKCKVESMPTIIDVAKRAGVSRSTVSRVLTDNKRVDPETREKVLKCIKELGYQPSRAAQTLRNKKTKLIAVLVPRISNTVFAELLQGIEEEAVKHQFNVLLCNTDYSANKEHYFLNMLKNGQVDGVIMAAFQNKIEEIQPFQVFGPIIFAGEYTEESLFPTVMIDNRMAAFKATEHLIKLGHTGIGMVNGAFSSIIARDREIGFRQALESYKIPVNENWIKSLSYGIGQGRDYFKLLLNEGKYPTAIFAANDELAIGVIQCAKEHGMRIPNDLAVIGFDDQPIATIIEPKLTTIQQPIRIIGSRAMLLMKSALEGETSVAKEVLPTKLIKRHSC